MSGFTTAFLDRDGTINRKAAEGEYVGSPDLMELLPGAAYAVRRLNLAGVLVVIVTNQRGVATGSMTIDDVNAVNGRLVDLLAASGAHVDAVYVCPHGEGDCGCRKPLPGLLHLAASDHPTIELSRSVLIGDSESDIGAGVAAGVATIRIAASTEPTAADATVRDLAEAVDVALSDGRRSRGG